MIHLTKLALLATLTVCLTGCEQIIDLLTPDQDWNVDMKGIQTTADVFARTSQLQYAYSDNWPTPPQVAYSQQADCKGYAIYAIQMLHQMGLDAQFVVASVQEAGVAQPEPHAMVYCQGKIYEPQAPSGQVPDSEIVVSYSLWTYSRLRDYVKAEYATGHGRSAEGRGAINFR